MGIQIKDKWAVYGEYGGTFTNLKDAIRCAREASKTPEYDYCAEIWNIDQGVYHIECQNGKIAYDSRKG